MLGRTADIPRLVEEYQIQRIIVAIPTAPLKRQQEIIQQCQQTGLITYSLPGVYELLAGHKTISRLPQVDVNRLLRRDPVVTDQTEVAAASAWRDRVGHRGRRLDWQRTLPPDRPV